MTWLVPLTYLLLTVTLLALLVDFYREKRRGQRRTLLRERHDRAPHEATKRSTRASLAGKDTPLGLLNLSTVRRYEEARSVLYNMGSRDFMGYGSFAVSPSQRRTWTEALEKFGCGSCGPRTFYGTMDAHRVLEERLKAWWGAEDALLYSGWKQLVMSLPSAFASGLQHVIVYDEAVRYPIVQGIELARCTGISYLHNDMEDLEEKLRAQQQQQVAAAAAPRFLYVEGVYLNRGTVCDLRCVADLAYEYGYRLIVDDTLGFGVLGSTQGTLEHCGVDLSEVSMLVIGLDAALGSVGAVCIGTKETIVPQHTSAPGFLYSASSPPFHLECARSALGAMLSEEGTVRQKRLLSLSSTFLKQALGGGGGGDDDHLQPSSYSRVPVYHLYVFVERGSRTYTLTLDIEEARTTLKSHSRYAIEQALEAASRQTEKELSVRVPRVMHERANTSLHPPCLRVALGLGNTPAEDVEEWFRRLLESLQGNLNIHYE